MIKFSVVIPLYNKEPHIARALNSVLSQSLTNYEIIVVDDGSTDDSAGIVKQFKDSRITLIRQDNAGVSSARNRGIEEACGNFIAFLDADDEWMPNHLKAIQRLTQKYPGAGIYATAYQIIQRKERVKNLGFKGVPSAPTEGIIPSYFKSATVGVAPVTSSTACIPKYIFNEVGQFLVGKRMGEDLEMWGRIALRYPIVFSSVIDATIYHNAINRACLIYKNEDKNAFIDTAIKALNDNRYDNHFKDDLRQYIAKLKLVDAKKAIVAGEYSKASEIIDQLRISEIGLNKIILTRPLSYAWRLIWIIYNHI